MSSALLETPPQITPEQLLQLPDGGKGYELVNGQLKELNVSALSSFVAGKVYRALDTFVSEKNLGWVFPEGTSFQCFPTEPKKVRRADTAFIALHRMSQNQFVAEGHITVVPDLVVEVISPNDLAYEVDSKSEEWIAAGVRLLWVVSPQTRQVRVSGEDGRLRSYRESDTLSGDPVLPGFSCSVSDFFRFPIPQS